MPVKNVAIRCPQEETPDGKISEDIIPAASAEQIQELQLLQDVFWGLNGIE